MVTPSGREFGQIDGGFGCAAVELSLMEVQMFEQYRRNGAEVALSGSELA